MKWPSGPTTRHIRIARFAVASVLTVLVANSLKSFLITGTDWNSAKKVLGESNFLASIKNYDKSHVKDSIISKVKKYINNPEFTPEGVTKVSVAAGALCTWCHAIYLYCNVSKEVAPKRARLKAAQSGLATKQAALKVASDQLAVVVAKVAELKRQYDESVGEKNHLKQEAEDLEDKLNRAEKLINGLGGEYTRWQASIGTFESSIRNLVGDSLVGAGFMSYAGPFDATYRTWASERSDEFIVASFLTSNSLRQQQQVPTY